MTAPELPFDPAEVRRVHTEHGSYPLPALEMHWPPLARLAWHARLVEIDQEMPPGTLVVVQPDPDQALYAVRSPDSWSYPWVTYNDLWGQLNHIARGWRIARAVDARAAAAG